MFDPGDRREYGISIDWVGKIVLSPSQRARLARVHQRGNDGALAPIEFEIPQQPEFHMGGRRAVRHRDRLPRLHANDPG